MNFLTTLLIYFNIVLCEMSGSSNSFLVSTVICLNAYLFFISRVPKQIFYQNTQFSNAFITKTITCYSIGYNTYQAEFWISKVKTSPTWNALWRKINQFKVLQNFVVSWNSNFTCLSWTSFHSNLSYSSYLPFSLPWIIFPFKNYHFLRAGQRSIVKSTNTSICTNSITCSFLANSHVVEFFMLPFYPFHFSTFNRRPSKQNLHFVLS